MPVYAPTSAPRAPTRKRLNLGFTLVEMMVVVAIVAILAALAGPNFRDLIDGWRVRSATEEITSTIYYARSEAIKRGGRVSVGKNCTVGTNQEWECGWQVITDANGNGTVDAGAPDLDVVLQTFPAQTGVNVNHIRNTAFFTVDRWGQINGLGAASFSITPIPLEATSRHASALCITAGGRIKTTKGTVSC